MICETAVGTYVPQHKILSVITVHSIVRKWEKKKKKRNVLQAVADN